MPLNSFNSSDPIVRARNIEGLIELLKEHCSMEAERYADPESRTLYETSANVLDGLSKTFQNYIRKDHVPWESYEDSIPQKSLDPWD